MSLLTLLENAGESSTAFPETPLFAPRLIQLLQPWIAGDLESFSDASGVMFDPVLYIAEEVGSDGEAGYIPGYGRLFDVDLCPAKDLGYLGQYVGVVIPVGAHEAEARQIVRAESGQNRATLSSVESAVVRSISSPWMPGTAYAANGPLVSHESRPGHVVYYRVTAGFTSGALFSLAHLEVVSITAQYDILEREKPSGEEAPYHFVVIAKPEQLTPAGSTTQLASNVSSVKPAGLIGHYLASELAVWDDATKTWNEVAASVTWKTVLPGDT